LIQVGWSGEENANMQTTLKLQGLHLWELKALEDILWYKKDASCKHDQ